MRYLPRFCLSLLICGLSTALSAQYQFTVQTTLPCTPVESQGRTGTCWSFATSSFVESEAMRTGLDAYDLSEMYIVRHVYKDKARNYLLRQGKANFSEGSLAHDLVRTIDEAGIVPESAYPGMGKDQPYHDHSEMSAVLKSVLDALVDRKPISDNWDEVIDAVLDIYLGETPQSFEVDGKTYTPKSYAQMLGFDGEDYLNITSFTHHPFYESFILEIPDNYSNGSYDNVPLNELVEIVDAAVNAGFSVTWDGDVSEKGFDAKRALAIIPADPSRDDLFEEPGAEPEVTQQMRQEAFESYETTDDHLMHITGIATDQNGTKYYIVKNSWGEVGPEKGFLYMSEAYFRMKTVAITVHGDALPAGIASKIAVK